MQFSTVERDFVERTLQLLEQYDRFVVPKTGHDERYEVTLLLNCLVGLIVLPFEHSKREQNNEQYPQVVNDDTRLVEDLDPKWGLVNLQIRRLKIDGNKRPTESITLRETIALVRHSLAHARFDDAQEQNKSTGWYASYKTFSGNPIESLIFEVDFINEYRDRVEFEASIPVGDLRNFATTVAAKFLLRLDGPKAVCE